MGFASTGSAQYISIAVDPSDNKAVIVSSDGAVGIDGKALVMKWGSGTTWLDLGFASSGVANYTSIAIDPSDDKPTVVCSDGAVGIDGRVHVMKWNIGTAWIDHGFTGDEYSNDVVSAMDSSDSNPFLIFTNSSDSNRAHVMRRFHAP